MEIYQITKKFPNDEKFGLISQMRRAAVSIVANLVEATKRQTVKDRNNFHTIADTSLEELKYYIFLSFELKYINKSEMENLIRKSREVGAMLNGLIKNLNKKQT